MEDDEETSNVFKSSLQEVEDLTMEDKPLEIEELAKTEQCEFVPQSLPELVDSQLVGAESSIPGKSEEDEEAVVEEEEGIPKAGTGMETETEAEAVESGGEKSVPELDDSQLVGVESPIAAKDEDDEAVAEETLMADPEMETEIEVAEGSGGKSVQESDDAQLVGAESPITTKDDEDVEEVPEEENPVADTEIEMETETETAKDSVGESFPELDDAQLVGAESPIVAKDDDDEEEVAEDETPVADTEMETETDVAEMLEAEKGGDGGGGKRKRGKNSRVPVRAPARKTIEEDVCFICFDGGDLVLCDRR